MYSSTFIFDKKQFDEAFFDLDNKIAEIAKSIEGYIGEESWENPTTGYVSNVYYWDSLEALQQLVNHPTHLAAKQNHKQWLNSYQVVISEVIKTYGDKQLGALPLG